MAILYPTLSVALEDARPRTQETREMLQPEDIQHVDAVRDMDQVIENVRVARQEIELLEARPSNESFGGFFEAGVNFLKKFVGSLRKVITGLVGTMTDLKKGLLGTKTVKGNYTKFINYANNREYMTIKDITKLYQINRLGVDWKTYIDELYPLAVQASKVKDEIVVPMIDYFGKGINEPSLFQSVTHRPKYQKKDIEKTQTTLKKIFNGPLTEYVTWGQAFKRNGDVVEMFMTFNEIQSVLNEVSPENMSKTVTMLSDYANQVFDELEKENGDFTLNKAQVNSLSDGLFVTAKYVEFYTVIYRLAYEFDQCVVASQQRFLKD